MCACHKSGYYYVMQERNCIGKSKFCVAYDTRFQLLRVTHTSQPQMSMNVCLECITVMGMLPVTTLMEALPVHAMKATMEMVNYAHLLVRPYACLHVMC